MRGRIGRIRLWWWASVLVVVTGAGLPAASIQPDGIEWMRSFTTIGPAPNAANAVATDWEGSVYVVGYVGGALPGETADRPVDAFVRKYDVHGALLWTDQFGTESPVGDEAFGVSVDASGVFVVGVAAGPLTDPANSDLSEVFLRKYAHDGTVIWTRQFGTPGTDQTRGIFVDPSGVYVVGTVMGVVPGQSSVGGRDAVLRKYDLEGDVLWTRQFGTTGMDQALAVSGDSSGVYVSGVLGLPPGITMPISQAFVRKFDGTGSELWHREIGGLGIEQATGVAVDESGVYVTGYSLLPLPGQMAGTNDAFVRKYDADGSEAWTRQFGSSGSDQALAISTDAQGVTVTGFVQAAIPGQTSSGDFDAFVRRYNRDGQEQWTRQFGTAGTDRGFGVASRGSRVHVVGLVGGVLPGQQPVGAPDAFIRTYDLPSGTELWTRQFGTVAPQGDDVQAIEIDGDVYVASSFGLAFFNRAAASGGSLRKYGVDGHELWARDIFTGVVQPGQGVFGVAADPSGVYIAGTIAGSLPGQQSAGGTDVFVRKYDFDGNEIWTRQFGTTGPDSASGMGVGAAGVYVAGGTGFGALPGQVSAGSTDVFVRKYDRDGNELWTRQFGTTRSESAERISVAGPDLYVAGTTSGVFPGQSSAAGLELFIRQYDENGVEGWTRQFGTTGLDRPNGLAADMTGVYLVGSVIGALPGKTHAGLLDAFVRRYDRSGNELWTDQFGGPGVDTATAVAADAEGAYVGGGGAFQGLQPGSFLRRYDAAGAVAWTLPIDSILPALQVTPTALAATPTDLYMGASTFSGDTLVVKLRVAPPTQVSIDIKPGDSTNPINLRSRGTLPVAVLSSDTFDAAAVDPGSIDLAGAPVEARPHGPAAALEDVNGDGRPDLVLHVDTAALQLNADDVEAILTGETYGGEPISGADAIRIVP